MPSQILAVIAEALAEVTERPVPEVSSERFDHQFDLDSYMFVQFLLALEDKQPGLRFYPESVGHAGLATVGNLADYIGGRLASPQERANA